MGPTKIMIIRHAEKPGTYGGQEYSGNNAFGDSDAESLVSFGWQRAGGIANLFYPSSGQFQNPDLAAPDFIYASNPATVGKKEPSQRPYQTIAALAAKMNITPNTSFDKSAFKHSDGMVADVLTQSTDKASCVVLISWQHEDILPKAAGDESIVHELVKRTESQALEGLPRGAWPGSRYDMVFVFDRPSGTGPFTRFTQVPQMLLAGDSTVPIG